MTSLSKMLLGVELLDPPLGQGAFRRLHPRDTQGSSIRAEDIISAAMSMIANHDAIDGECEVVDTSIPALECKDEIS